MSKRKGGHFALQLWVATVCLILPSLTLVPLGGTKDSVARIGDHLSAGADHVPLWPLPVSEDPIPAFTAIADELKSQSS